MNKEFLIDAPSKRSVLRMLANGLRGDWGELPKPGIPVTNFLKTEEAVKKCRRRFINEITKGRMLGGPGWSAETVSRFLGSTFYYTPCGAVPKRDDPYGRIIHNYSHQFDGVSLNDCLIDNSTEYISFKDRVKLLNQVKYYIKLDLKDGYRQLAVHPSEWRTQVYSLGPREHYIDIAMPFGKSNSSKLFCRWASLWFESCITRFNKKYAASAVLRSYVDDGFGGADTWKIAIKLIKFITDMGLTHETIVNTAKTEGPATALVILGLLYCSQSKVCRLDPAKVTKYAARISTLLAVGVATSKDLERLVGNLQFASWVEPFGRPLLSFIALKIAPEDPTRVVHLSPMMRVAMRVWLLLLHRNRGLTFGYVLDKLPIERRKIYVDAASTGGIGGYAEYTYFTAPLRHISPFLRRCSGWAKFPRVDIAWLELFAAYVAIDLFAARSPGHYMILYTDNMNVVAWLSRRRSPSPYVGALVSAIERLKYQYMLKLSARYIPSTHNVSADLLSRKKIPMRFLRHGTRVYPNMARLCSNLLISNIWNRWSLTVPSSCLPS